MRQDLYRLHNLADPGWRVLDLEPGHVGEKAIEIVKDFRREFDASHAAGQRRGLRATGLRGRSPRERVRNHGNRPGHGCRHLRSADGLRRWDATGSRWLLA